MLLLPASVTHRDAGEAMQLLAPALKREPESGVVVDASSLRHFDSAALAVLLECKRLAVSYGRGFSVLNVPPKLAQLARLYGLDETVSIDAGRLAGTATVGPARGLA